jgi:hypothetical protein
MSGYNSSGNKVHEVSEAEARLLVLQISYLPDRRRDFRTRSVKGKERRKKTKKACSAHLKYGVFDQIK